MMIRTQLQLNVRLLTVLILVSLVLVGPAAPAAYAAPAPIVGAGSTWSQIAVDQWRADVAKFGLSVNYVGNGSSQGRAWFAGGQADFAVSEIPYERNEPKPKRPFTYLPIVAGGTSLMYNLVGTNGKRITDLNLSSKTAVGIFTGTITSWRDPLIVRENPKLANVLPDARIIPVVRSDGSGTSAQFSSYLSSMEPAAWSKFSKAPYVSFWPNFPGSVSQQGSDGVANFVANSATGSNAITYVERGYATSRGFPTANLKNASGRYVQSEARNVAIALTHAKFNKDGTQNLEDVYRAPEPQAYPMSSYSYMIAPTKGFDPAKGETLGRFIIYFACHGQRQAESLGYSPLPEVLVENAFDAVRKIPGAPAPPPVSSCSSKDLQRELLSGPSGHGSTGGTGSTSSDLADRRDEGPGRERALDDPALSAPQAAVGPAASDEQAVAQSADQAAAPSLAPSLLGAGLLVGLIFGPVLMWRRPVRRLQRP